MSTPSVWVVLLFCSFFPPVLADLVRPVLLDFCRTGKARVVKRVPSQNHMFMCFGRDRCSNQFHHKLGGTEGVGCFPFSPLSLFLSLAIPSVCLSLDFRPEATGAVDLQKPRRWQTPDSSPVSMLPSMPHIGQHWICGAECFLDGVMS